MIVEGERKQKESEKDVKTHDSNVNPLRYDFHRCAVLWNWFVHDTGNMVGSH